MDASDKLEEIFRNFPGIGPRQAKRFVYHLLTQSQSQLSDLSKYVSELKSTISVCASCFRFFPVHSNKAASTVLHNLCSICSDSNRNQNQLMVVARDIDLQAIEKSRAYNGKYLVLGGTVPILDQEPSSKIRQSELLELLSKNNFSEIIIATSVNPESEYTATYISSIIKKYYESTNTKNESGVFSIPKITSLGRGLATGTELEYSDSDTLRSALENRR